MFIDKNRPGIADAIDLYPFSDSEEDVRNAPWQQRVSVARTNMEPPFWGVVFEGKVIDASYLDYLITLQNGIKLALDMVATLNCTEARAAALPAAEQAAESEAPDA